MINWPIIFRFQGFIILGVSISMIPALAIALLASDGSWFPFLASLLGGTALGGGLVLRFRPEPKELNDREGTLIVVVAWVTAVLAGTMPFWLSPDFAGFTDAFFESMSGFTTTGATILPDIEGLPKSLRFWRSMTHWMGGMGIIVLGIAILPLIGAGGSILYKAESSGAKSEKLKPRISETASTLWKIYFFFTLLEYFALRFAGMTSFEAVCHAFSTMATGGFSTRALSVESFASPLIEYIIIVFMLISGLNFALHYKFLVKREFKVFALDTESRAYFGIILAAVIAITVTILYHTDLPLEESFRISAFQVVSVMSCTGFTSTDFEEWVPFAQLLLLILMFIGGCVGSTAGGIKVSRIVLIRRVISREFRRLSRKRGVFAVWTDGKAVPESTISSLLSLVYLFFIVNFFVSLFLIATGVDIITAISATTSCMSNVGPGLGEVGATDNYGHFSFLGKWILSAGMLVGRLELYTVLVIFSRAFWRK